MLHDPAQLARLVIGGLPRLSEEIVIPRTLHDELCQRSDAKSPGASTQGLLFMRGSHATVSGVRFVSMEPAGSSNVFRRGPGGFPHSHSDPGPEKVMKPRIISLRRGFFISPVVPGRRLRSALFSL